MAVVTAWVNSSVEAEKKGNTANVMPGKLFAFACTFEIAAADSDASIFRLARLKSNMIPVSLLLNCDALTDSTSWDMGLYKTNGDVQDVDCFMAATDISTGYGIGSEINCLSALPIDDIGKKLWEITAVAAVGTITIENKEDAYDLALTANTIGSAAGTISVRGLFIAG